jgi:ArsR family transcriptional regulator
MQPLTFYKCLSDQTRLCTLLLLLEQGELCVCQLMQAQALSQPKISRHLALLREKKILVSRKQGQWVYYSLSPELPLWARENLALCLTANPELISTHLDALKSADELSSACCE